MMNMTSSMVLSDEFLQDYDFDRHVLFVDLMVNGKWIPSGTWKDIGYVGLCCQDSGMYAITHHYQEKIEQARVRIYPGSGVDGSGGDWEADPVHELFLSPRDLRYLAREHKARLRYKKLNNKSLN